MVAMVEIMRARSARLLCAALAACSADPQSSVGPPPGRTDVRVSTPSVEEAVSAASPEPSVAASAEVASTSASAAISAAPVASGPPRPRITSVGMTTWIRKRPEVKEGEFLGYVRTGFSIELRANERVAGQGCPGGFYQVVPRGYVCNDRTVSASPREGFRAAAEATKAKPGPFPYGYALSNGAPMYNRIPTPKEQARYERWLGKPGSREKMPKTLRSHEELAEDKEIAAPDPVPSFLLNGGSPKEAPYDLVEQTIPLGAMLSYSTAFEAEGRRWLLSSDHTVVPADRVRPFRPSTFHGVALDDKVSLPIAWMRQTDKPRYRREGDAMVKAGVWPVRTWVGVTGARVESGGVAYLESRERVDGAPLYVAEKDATVVEAETKRGMGVKEGQKWFLIRLTKGTLVAYEDETPVYATLVSPGKGGVPVKGRDPVEDGTTPLGSYSLTFKDRAATMSPETGKDRSFWIQDVPHTMYFNPPFALHAAFWHERFGEYVSAGCINLSPLDAEAMFAWADPAVPEGWQGATGAGASENGPTTIVVVRR